MDISLITIY